MSVFVFCPCVALFSGTACGYICTISEAAIRKAPTPYTSVISRFVRWGDPPMGCTYPRRPSGPTYEQRAFQPRRAARL